MQQIESQNAHEKEAQTSLTLQHFQMERMLVIYSKDFNKTLESCTTS